MGTAFLIIFDFLKILLKSAKNSLIKLAEISIKPNYLTAIS